MADPNLFYLMHGQANKKAPDSSLNKPKESDVLAFEEALQNEVDSLMAVEKRVNIALLPEKAMRDKIEYEVRAASNCSEFGKRMSLAYKMMRTEGSALLEDRDNKILQENLDELCQRLQDLDLRKFTEAERRSALEMPEESKKHILKIGIKKYSEGSLEASLAIFTFLTYIDRDNPDYWYRLGRIAQKIGNYDLAMQAFTSTSKLAPEFIEARLSTAECYLKDKRLNEADSELKEIKHSANLSFNHKRKIDDLEDKLEKSYKKRRKVI